MTKYALAILTFENNIGFKLAALDTYLKHIPDNMDIYFVYGGNISRMIHCKRDGISYTDVYIKTPDSISNVHKKLFGFFKKIINKDYTHTLKVDDDTFLYNVDTFLEHKISGDYVGNKVLITDEEFVRNKFCTLKNYKIRKAYQGGLPNQYCSGECVIFSKKSMQTIVKYKGKEKYEKFSIEDVAIGNILQKSSIKINPNKFLNYEHPVQIEKFFNLYNRHYVNELIPT
tara:strand:+ start:1767 stop:2453 length:687 start_codon:yes stop_codon:yes gene_type:complete